MLKHAILVTGPNASGKTTLVDQAAAPWAGDDRLAVVHGDTGKFSAGGPPETLAALLEVWNSDAKVVLVEGIDRTARAFHSAMQGDREVQVYVLCQAPAVMLAHLRTRCEKRGKAFNAHYWTPYALDYEGARRYRGLASRMFPYATEVQVDLSYSVSSGLADRIQGWLFATVGPPAVDPPKGQEPEFKLW